MKKRAPAPKDKPTASEIVYGLRAAMAVFAVRPNDLARVGYAHERRRDVAELSRWAADHGIACDEMSDEDLARVASSTHHEGLVVRAAARKWSSMADLADALVRSRGFAIALDRVRNPYNVGAILRSAAFFGMDAVLLGALAPRAGVGDGALAPDAIRVAEGGAEHLRLSRTTDLADTLVRLRGRGLRVVGAESDAGASLFGHALRPPTVLVVGHEREGLSPSVRAACDELVGIPGAGAVDSLNVGVAASLCIAELARSRPPRR